MKKYNLIINGFSRVVYLTYSCIFGPLLVVTVLSASINWFRRSGFLNFISLIYKFTMMALLTKYIFTGVIPVIKTVNESYEDESYEDALYEDDMF